MITLYGLKNCDTCRKALKALQAAGLNVILHDVREDGLSQQQLHLWVKTVGYERLLNTRSTTWRSIDAALKENVDASKAMALMMENPTLIKRPVIEQENAIHVGWSKETQDELLS